MLSFIIYHKLVHFSVGIIPPYVPMLPCMNNKTKQKEQKTSSHFARKDTSIVLFMVHTYVPLLDQKWQCKILLITTCGNQLQY